MSYFIIFFENREGLRKLFKHLTCILLLFSFQNLFAHEDDMNDLEISILTCSKGKELYSIFGHSAIRIKNSANGSDNVYDFGVFNSGQPFFLVNFINGNLKYTLEKRDFAEFVDSYRNENRGVYSDLPITAICNFLVETGCGVKIVFFTDSIKSFDEPIDIGQQFRNLIDLKRLV